jgi:hypothetical protein
MPRAARSRSQSEGLCGVDSGRGHEPWGIPQAHALERRDQLLGIAGRYSCSSQATIGSGGVAISSDQKYSALTRLLFGRGHFEVSHVFSSRPHSIEKRSCASHGHARLDTRAAHHKEAPRRVFPRCGSISVRQPAQLPSHIADELWPGSDDNASPQVSTGVDAD